MFANFIDKVHAAVTEAQRDSATDLNASKECDPLGVSSLAGIVIHFHSSVPTQTGFPKRTNSLTRLDEFASLTISSKEAADDGNSSRIRIKSNLEMSTAEKLEIHSFKELKEKTVRVELLGHQTAETVHVAGSFDDWETRVQASPTFKGWSARISKQDLAPGTKIFFKFVVDGVWTLSSAHETETNHNGGGNNFLLIPGQPSVNNISVDVISVTPQVTRQSFENIQAGELDSAVSGISVNNSGESITVSAEDSSLPISEDETTDPSDPLSVPGISIEDSSLPISENETTDPLSVPGISIEDSSLPISEDKMTEPSDSLSVPGISIEDSSLPVSEDEMTEPSDPLSVPGISIEDSSLPISEDEMTKPSDPLSVPGISIEEDGDALTDDESEKDGAAGQSSKSTTSSKDDTAGENASRDLAMADELISKYSVPGISIEEDGDAFTDDESEKDEAAGQSSKSITSSKDDTAEENASRDLAMADELISEYSNRISSLEETVMDLEESKEESLKTIALLETRVLERDQDCFTAETRAKSLKLEKEDLENTLSELQQHNQSLQSRVDSDVESHIMLKELNQLKKEMNGIKDERADLLDENDTLKEEVESLRSNDGAVVELQKKLEAALKSVETMEKSLAQLNAENEGLRSSLSEMESVCQSLKETESAKTSELLKSIETMNANAKDSEIVILKLSESEITLQEEIHKLEQRNQELKISIDSSNAKTSDSLKELKHKEEELAQSESKIAHFKEQVETVAKEAEYSRIRVEKLEKELTEAGIHIEESQTRMFKLEQELRDEKIRAEETEKQTSDREKSLRLELDAKNEETILLHSDLKELTKRLQSEEDSHAENQSLLNEQNLQLKTENECLKQKIDDLKQSEASFALKIDDANVYRAQLEAQVVNLSTDLEKSESEYEIQIEEQMETFKELEARLAALTAKEKSDGILAKSLELDLQEKLEELDKVRRDLEKTSNLLATVTADSLQKSQELSREKCRADQLEEEVQNLHEQLLDLEKTDYLSEIVNLKSQHELIVNKLQRQIKDRDEQAASLSKSRGDIFYNVNKLEKGIPFYPLTRPELQDCKRDRDKYEREVKHFLLSSKSSMEAVKQAKEQVQSLEEQLGASMKEEEKLKMELFKAEDTIRLLEYRISFYDSPSEEKDSPKPEISNGELIGLKAQLQLVESLISRFTTEQGIPESSDVCDSLNSIFDEFASVKRENRFSDSNTDQIKHAHVSDQIAQKLRRGHSACVNTVGEIQEVLSKKGTPAKTASNHEHDEHIENIKKENGKDYQEISSILQAARQIIGEMRNEDSQTIPLDSIVEEPGSSEDPCHTEISSEPLVVEEGIPVSTEVKDIEDPPRSGALKREGSLKRVFSLKRVISTLKRQGINKSNNGLEKLPPMLKSLSQELDNVYEKDLKPLLEQVGSLKMEVKKKDELAQSERNESERLRKLVHGLQLGISARDSYIDGLARKAMQANASDLLK
ncbi:MAG: hypothetical protein SGCHY_001597 [Lobulomycetales sp.]